MIHLLFIAVTTILPSQAQNPESHPCITEARRNEIFEEYKKKNSEAKLSEKAKELLEGLNKNADKNILDKISKGESLTTNEEKSFQESALKSIKSALPTHTNCREDKAECIENTFSHRKIFSIDLSDNTHIIYVCAKSDIIFPVAGLGISGEQFYPNFEPKTCIFVRNGKVQETQESVEVIYPYNQMVDPPGNMYWKPTDPNLLKGMVKNDARYCENRARRMEEDAAVDSTERGIIPSKDSKPSAGPTANNPGVKQD